MPDLSQCLKSGVGSPNDVHVVVGAAFAYCFDSNFDLCHASCCCCCDGDGFDAINYCFSRYCC